MNDNPTNETDPGDDPVEPVEDPQPFAEHYDRQPSGSRDTDPVDPADVPGEGPTLEEANRDHTEDQ